MSVQAPGRKPGKIVWILAGILCACTLVALWVTGARVKALKLAARRGEAIDPLRSDGGPSRLVLRRNQRIRVGHFWIHLNNLGNMNVLDSSGRPLVEFLRQNKGQLRRWQELQLTIDDVSPDEMSLSAEFKPGAPCFGAGLYRAIRQGLRIEFAGNRSATITAWDPRKPELTLKFQSAQGDVERKVDLNEGGRDFGLSYRLQREADGECGLLLDHLD